MAAVGITCVLAKAAYWRCPAFTENGLRDYIRDLLISSHPDVAFCLTAALAFGLVFAIGRRLPLLQKIAWGAMLVFGLAVLIWAIASVQIFSFLRSPLTYGLWYLAGDMLAMRSSISTVASVPSVIVLFAFPILFLWIARHSRSWPRPRSWKSLLVVVGALTAWVAYGHIQVQGSWGDRDDRLIARSPHWALISSVVREIFGNEIPHMEADFPREYLSDFQPQKPSERAALRGFPTKIRPRNVIMVVLESVGAHYMSLYGSKYPTTPTLLGESQNAIVFENFYCHAGLSANCAASVSLSIFPYMTWREYTVEYPDYPGRTLANMLQSMGYRTAYIHSGDLSYNNQRRFLRLRGFDEILDLHDLGENHRISSWGGDDMLLADSILKCIDRDHDRPFYIFGWTIESHHPYESRPDHAFIDFFRGMPQLPPDDYDLGRYLNTVHSTDEALGRLFNGLRERGLADDTLVVVMGDHGEAFGDPHPTWGHGPRVYQENVHIPFMIWNPKLFTSGVHSKTIGGHVDVNPTIAHLLGLPPDAGWRGRSLFDAKRPPRTYFYAANDDYLLGLREDRWKYIFNITRGRDELYDLSRDPEERTSVAVQHPSECRRFRQRIAAWRSEVAAELAQVRNVAAAN